MEISALRLYVENKINTLKAELKETKAKTKQEGLKGQLEAYQDVRTKILTKEIEKVEKPTTYEIEGVLSLVPCYQSDISDKILSYLLSNIVEVCIPSADNKEEFTKVGTSRGYIGNNGMLLFEGEIDMFADKKLIDALYPHLLYDGETVRILLNNVSAESKIRIK